MDLFQKCKELYEKIRYFEYGIPVDGIIKGVPSAEYFAQNYHFLKPEEFEKYKGGICWDYVEYERKFLEVNDIDFNQYYLITNTPPNYDTHTFITVKDGDDLIYIESSFKRVEHIIDGVQKFKTLEDIVRLITTNMWYCNDNDKHFDEFKYDVCKFKGHPQYGCTCEEYMKWMDDNSDIVIQDVTINPKKVNEDELTVESCNFFQEGLFNFGKPKEPVDVMVKLSETFGELSEAQIDIVSRLNSGIRFTFEIFNTKFYDILIKTKKIDEFLVNEASIIKNSQGISNNESILPIGSLGIIPDMNKVLEFYENFEEGNLSYDDMISHMNKPEDGTTRVRVYADRDGKIYSCLSWNGGYTIISDSFDEFINGFPSYTFKLEENSYTVNRRYFTKDGLDVFTDPTSRRRGETIPFKTTYKLDTDDITAVYALQSRFTNPWCRFVFDPTSTGDGEVWDFMVDYESYEEIEKQCNQKGIKEFYTSMKIIEQTFHKPIDHARLKGIYPTKITYVFALNESLDKPFMSVEVESGKVMSVKFNDSTINEYADPEEYDETLHDHIDDEDDIYNESFKSDMRKKNVQLQRKNKVTEMNEMKQAIRKHVKHAKDGTLVLNAEEIDPKNLPKEIKFTKNLITEIPATTEERAVKWIKRKLENMQFTMDLYKEAEKEFKSTNDYKAKDRMNEYKELLLNDNNFLINNFNFSAFEFTKPDVKETLMFNQAIRYLAELVNKMNDFNIKSKRQEIASLLGTKYGDDVVIMAKAGKPAITWNNSFSPNYVDIRLSKRANKVYQDADKSMLIHFSKYEGLTELDPGVKSNYGDFTKFGNGKWFYKNPCVHFFAFRMGKFGAHITKQHLKQLMDVYGSHFYVYKPQASDKIYYDVMETGHSSSIHVHGVDAVFIETNKPLPVKEYSVDVFPILNDINRNKNSMITLKESYTDPEEYDETLHDHIADEDDVYNESWTDFKNGVHPSSNLMFHVSLKNDMDGKTITPQLPSYITDGGELDDNYQEDTKTKRLCVSPSIEGCLIAILNYKKIREHVGDKFYVYTPEKPFSQYKHKTNKEIVKDKLVFDANITKEAWILEPCKLKLYGIIKLKKVKDLKKKPTVEKGIKMNTIKLDYEWIMTPKASGKFNKAIGDSPDDESDKKEKPIKESANILVSNEEFFMEANKNLVKSLKILDYDPKTKTIKCDIPRYDGKPNKRVLFLIDDYISQEKGDGSVGRVVAKKKLLEEYRSRTSNPEKLKAIDADIEYLNTRNDAEWAISIPRKILKTRNLQNLITVNHELGHIYCRETTSGDDEWNEMQRWQRTRDEYNDIDRTVLNANHASSTEELYADTYAADKVSAHALQKTDEKIFKKFKQDMSGYIKKAKVKQQKLLNRLKNLPNKLTEEEEFEIKKQIHELDIEIGKLHKPGLPDSQQDPKAVAMVKEALKLEKKLDRLKDLPFEKNMIETELYDVGDVLDLYASAIKNLNIEHLTHDAYANKKDRIKFESFSVLVSNEEFFMEVSKYERRLNKQFQREYERHPKRAMYDYFGDEKHPRKSEKYARERINRVTQQRKYYEKAINIENSSVKTRNSSNKNKLKALKLLDYDPKTNTIKGNITLPDGSKKKRVPYIIENEVARNMGPFVGTIDEVRSMFDSIDFTNDKRPSSTELSRRQKVLNTLDQFEKNGEKFVIMIPRKFLNQRHLAGAGASLHELGHFTYIHDPNQSEETERAKTFRDSIKDKLTENTPSYMHLVKNPMGDMSATYGIDESNEFSADKYAADRIGVKNYERMLKKLINKFGKEAIKQAVISQINATEKQLKLLKSSNGNSNYKEILNDIKESAETFSRWSNEAQESVVQYKSKIKDLDKNIADINRKINEFKDHTSEISDELKELYKALESAKDERESAVEELKSKRESAKSNTDRADKLFNNASFVAQYKALKSSINNFKKWMDDYAVELNERINYIKKYHEKKNIGESCLIMDNDEFFGLMK